ncbi:MAG: hypothetical protein JXJ04_02790 [Spirochaetales bacterium]|nr:hypothetical protein [Spirochaetales bacterium]
MNIVEIIELRTMERDKILRTLNFHSLMKGFTTGNPDKVHPDSLFLFRHMSIDTDISLHVFYKDLKEKQPKLYFGLMLKNLLTDWGLVNYSIWEQENVSGGYYE